MQFVIYGIIVIALVILVRNIRIVPQAQAYVITRLGAYKTTWGVGLHLKVPFIEAVAKRLSLKEQVADFPPQPVITKDNVTMQIDTVVYYQITDPKLYTYGIEQPILAIENLSATTLRNLIGDLELDQCLTSRDIVNTKMRQILDEATDPWGIKVNRVELKNILPPKEIQNAMEKQMKAERERREAILRAEGEKRSAILMAEGEKESAVLRADAKKQEQILEAQGRAEAILTVPRPQRASGSSMSPCRPTPSSSSRALRPSPPLPTAARRRSSSRPRSRALPRWQPVWSRASRATLRTPDTQPNQHRPRAGSGAGSSSRKRENT